MKKKILCMALVLVMVFMLAGCNMQLIDTTYKFDRAVVKLADGTVVEGKCESWLDFENSDMVQVKINGKTYLTHITNVTLIAD